MSPSFLSSSPTSSTPTSAMSFPDPSNFPTLLGKSNFTKWRNGILPPLTSNPHSNALLFDHGSRPISPLSLVSQSPNSPQSIYYSPISHSSTYRSLPSPTTHSSPQPTQSHQAH